MQNKFPIIYLSPFFLQQLQYNLINARELLQVIKLQNQTKRMINVTISLTLLSRMKLPTFIKWTSTFSSPGLLGVVFHSYSNFNRTSCKQTVENLIRHCSLWRLILACNICPCPTKNASLIWVKYFWCICYSHQLYCFFMELDNDLIYSGFNHMNRHGVCYSGDRNIYD